METPGGPFGPLRWTEVDLDRIGWNVRRLVRFLGETRLLVVVKADGYGHGMVPVARRALAAGAAMLGVGTVDEGRTLRREGILAPVLLLQPLLDHEVPAAVAENLRITVCHRGAVDAVADAARRLGRGVFVHVKVDTGMGRFGASPAEALDLIEYIDQIPELHLEGVFSHLALAEAPGHPRHRVQTETFRWFVEECRRRRRAGLPLLHLANSAGALASPDLHLGMCRVGLACYGIYPQVEGHPPEGWPKLEPALSLHSRLVAVYRAEPGAGIGYGDGYSVPEATYIGVVAAGYANGVPRGLSNRGRVLVNGRSCPIVGRVCMNQTFVDLGPGGGARPGDEVVLLGRQGDSEIPVEEWCAHLGTIPHEVLCTVGGVRPRLYRSGRRVAEEPVPGTRDG